MRAVRGALACALAGVAAGAAIGTSAASAAGTSPERTGWWSALTLGGTTLPAPTTPEGDLRVANGPDGPTAYAALLYPAGGAAAATLTLAVATDRSVGTPELLACVITDDSWQAGGNQAFEAAPAFDCDLGSSVGEPTADGAGLTFRLDDGQLDPAGRWSLALVPFPDSTTLFSLELVAPGEDAFVPSAPPAPATEPTVPEAVGPAPDTATPADPGPAAFAPGAFAPEAFPPAGFDAGVLDPGLVAAPPVLAQEQPEQLLDVLAPAPAVAPAGAQTVQVAQASVARELGAAGRLLAVVVLAAGCLAVGVAAGQQQPALRLLGGRARVVGAGAPVAAGAVPAPRADRDRGIGRFAKPRDSAPRRLR